VGSRPDPYVENRAWLAASAFTCHEGVLELAEGRIRFVTNTGASIFDVSLDEARVEFPRIALGCGLTVASAEHTYRLWFSNPYLEGGTGQGRVIARHWRRVIRMLSLNTR
jgi:hypothetical protein